MKKNNGKNIRFIIKCLTVFFLILSVFLTALSVFLFYRTRMTFKSGYFPEAGGNFPSREFSLLINNIFILNIISTAVLAAIMVFLYILVSLYAKSKMNDLKEAAFFDPLTSLINKKSFLNTLYLEVRRAARNNYCISLILGNVDDFSQINRKYGKDVGDIVLKDISSIIKTALRSQDQVSRWGNDDFMIMLPETGLSGAHTAAEKIRKQVSEYASNVKKTRIMTTMSFGISLIEPDSVNFHEAIEKAESLCMTAKNEGKNRIK